MKQAMKNSRIPYLKWRNRVDEITPADHRIGTDILLIQGDSSDRVPFGGDEPFKLDMTMTIIYEKGTADLKINMKEYHVVAPSVLIVMNDQIYQPLGASDDLQCKIILMSRSFADSLFVNISNVLPLKSSILGNPVMSMDNEENVFGMFYQLLQNVAASPNHEHKIDVARHLTLSMFYGYSYRKHDVTDIKPATSRREEVYSQFISELEKSFRSQREISFYADRLCITPKYLSQIVKDVSGKTASAVIDEYVIAESKALLMSTSMSVQQISDELNFPSQSVFGKFFKRVTGLSPKEYRQKQ